MEPHRLTPEQQATVEANRDLIDHLAFRFAGRYHVDQDECRQVAMLRACEAVAVYDPAIGPIDPYLSTCCWHALVTFTKSWRPRPRHTLGGRADDVPERKGYRALARDLDLQLDLADTIAKLDIKEQYVIIHNFLGLSLKQVAKNLKCSRQTVWTIERQAIEKLRRSLGGYGKI